MTVDFVSKNIHTQSVKQYSHNNKSQDDRKGVKT